MNDQKIRTAFEKINEDPANAKAREFLLVELAGFTVIAQEPAGKVNIAETMDNLAFAVASGNREIPDCLTAEQLFAKKPPTFEANPVTGEALHKGKTVTKPVVDFSGISLENRRVIGYARLTNQLPHGGASCQSEMVAADFKRATLEAPWPRLAGELAKIDAAAKGGDREARRLSEAADDTIVFRPPGTVSKPRMVEPTPVPVPRVPVQLSQAVDNRTVRELIQEVYRTDSDQDAFFMNYFDEVYARFSRGMDRSAKITIGFEMVGGAAIVRAMQEDRGDAYARAMAKLQPAPTGLDLFILAQPRDSSYGKDLMDHCFAIKSRTSSLKCPVGTDAHSWIESQMNAARVIVAVVSTDLLCDAVAMSLLENAAISGRRVIPFIARPCAWKETFLGGKTPLSSQEHEAAAEIKQVLAAVGR